MKTDNHSPHHSGSVNRRRSVALIITMTVGAATTTSLQAQIWPSKPISIIVPYNAGGAVDIVARTLAEDLRVSFNQPVIVENKVGAGGNIGTDYVARSNPDGYTFVIAGGATTVAKQIYANLKYDPDDLTAVAMIGAAPALLVVASNSPFHDVNDLIAASKTKPGQITFGHGGIGTTSEHLAAEYFKIRTGADIITVSYKGGPAALNDLIGGQISAVFTNPINIIPMIKSGRLRALAVASDNRLSALPDVPTMAESGFSDFRILVWWGLMGPKGLPTTVVNKVNFAVNKALETGAIRPKLDTLSAFPIRYSPEEFVKFFAEEKLRWTSVARQIGLKPE